MSRLELAAFAYHDVCDDPSDSGLQRRSAEAYKLRCAEFRRHLDAMADGPCSPELIVDVDLRRPGRHLLLTFDDGGKSALRVSDMLAERGWRAHFFIVTSLIGGRTFLNAAEIREIRRGGHLIGSHSHTHPDIFRELTPRAMVQEWHVSRTRLSELLGEPCVAASVPGGDTSDLVARAAGEVGFRHLFTSDPYLAPSTIGECWVLGRFCLKAGMPAARIAEMARFHGWTGAIVRRRLSVLARRSAPPLYRWYVRNTTRERVAR